MAREQHLTYFKVENFKKFDSLELNDIGQFNLIVGDNNVGKTSLLEALLATFDSKETIGKLHKTLIVKGLNLLPQKVFSSKGEIINIQYPSENFYNILKKDGKQYFSFDIKNSESNLNISFREAFFSKLIETSQIEGYHTADFYYDGEAIDSFSGKSTDDRYLMADEHGYVKTEIEYEDYRPQDDIVHSQAMIGLYDYSVQKDIEAIQIPLVYTTLLKGDYLAKLFAEQTQNSRKTEKLFLKNLQNILLKNAEEISVGRLESIDIIYIGLEGVDKRLPITSFGESVVRVVQILLEIQKWRGQRLMIDEIDTGIHHSRLKEFLKTVFKVAELNDVQLFMTTHSLECQQAFVEVFEDPEMVGLQERARQFSLIETPEKQIVAQGFNFEQIKHALETGFDTRGGKRGW